SLMGMNMRLRPVYVGAGRGERQPLRRHCYTRTLMAEGQPSPTASPLSVGDLLLKRYRIVELLAEGGPSSVFRAQDERLCRTASGREPKLADFGIAQTIDAGIPDGASSVLLYSVNWAAPEQMVGDPVSAGSDVYSLALVTAYALTGKLIYHDGDPAQAYK